MVLTSPPYYNIEQYPYQPKRTANEWDDFYFTVFNRLWDNLQKGGTLAINVNQQIYKKILLPLFDEADFSFKLNIKQKTEYTEFVYIWIK
jgi:trans-aconitate methyltransferase